ncbi:MAG: chemotaxis protein CheW [Candidatus Kapabacteria bacterium]|nr:chemotaxis protein CheW [Candidatus Kapabacteria bacterium]
MNPNITENDDLISESFEDTLKDRYLTFRIGSEDYGIEIKYVTEIVGIQRITELPNIKPYIKGVINLRGLIIPVVEVRVRFGIEHIEYNERTCIIVVNFENMAIGLIVDEVNEVCNIASTDISETPMTNKRSQSRFIQGIGRIHNDVKILLNISKVLYDDIKENNAE